MKKLCFASSTGGHFEQLMMLKPLMQNYESIIITEKSQYSVENKEIKTYYLNQLNRKEKIFVFKMILNSLKTIKILIIENPDIIISTGALSTVPLCLLSKLLRKKIIFIESFAKINSPTLTGKLVYRFADQFYVQWEEMKSIYPKAIYVGGIY